MRLEIERGELLKALSHVTSVVERRTTIPILSNVMLKASGSSLTFKATDLEREDGRGLFLMRQLMDSVELLSGRPGNVVRLTLRRAS